MSDWGGDGDQRSYIHVECQPWTYEVNIVLLCVYQKWFAKITENVHLVETNMPIDESLFVTFDI